MAAINDPSDDEGRPPARNPNRALLRVTVYICTDEPGRFAHLYGTKRIDAYRCAFAPHFDNDDFDFTVCPLGFAKNRIMFSVGTNTVLCCRAPPTEGFGGAVLAASFTGMAAYGQVELVLSQGFLPALPDLLRRAGQPGYGCDWYVANAYCDDWELQRYLRHSLPTTSRGVAVKRFRYCRICDGQDEPPGGHGDLTIELARGEPAFAPRRAKKEPPASSGFSAAPPFRPFRPDARSAAAPPNAGAPPRPISNEHAVSEALSILQAALDQHGSEGRCVAIASLVGTAEWGDAAVAAALGGRGLDVASAYLVRNLLEARRAHLAVLQNDL